MEIRSDNEWLRWGNEETNYVGFFAPIETVSTLGDLVYVTCKYGMYCVDLITQKVTTIEGTSYEHLVEVAKYGMGYKYWESTQ